MESLLLASIFSAIKSGGGMIVDMISKIPLSLSQYCAV